MIKGQDRNEPTWVAHLYEGDFNDPGRPYCVRGWNREDGRGYSIYRGLSGESGICAVCMRRYLTHKSPIEERDRKTKWI